MLSIAVIGAGRIGHVHAKTIAAHPQAELALVCDPFEDAAEKLAATYGARSCKDAEEVSPTPRSTPSSSARPRRCTSPTCWPPPRTARRSCARSRSPWT